MKVLLTGATGYVGRRLKIKLLDDPNIELTLLVRNIKKLSDDTLAKARVVIGDSFNIQSLEKALEGIDTAYYLIHSMDSSKDNYSGLDRLSAENFLNACIKKNVKRIIYLGGPGSRDDLSEHIKSRMETGEILSSQPDKVQCIYFRAGIIIGSGSASYEIIRNLVEKLPVMITPKWVHTQTQPIAIHDVLEYLYSAVYLKAKECITVDIGSDKLSFSEMMLRTAKGLGLKRYMISVPVLTPKLSSYWLIIFTPVPYNIASSLVEGLKTESIKLNANDVKYFSEIKPLSFDEAVQKTILAIEKKLIISRWSDSGAIDTEINTLDKDLILKLEMQADISESLSKEIFERLINIGGVRGWFNFNMLWKIRGAIDKFFGGYGLSRGKRESDDIRVGDSVDFFRIVDIQHNKRLLLKSEMKLPGEGWLEFLIEGNQLKETAYFYPKGVIGRLYWYILYPFHWLTFKDILRNILRKNG